MKYQFKRRATLICIVILLVCSAIFHTWNLPGRDQYKMNHSSSSAHEHANCSIPASFTRRLHYQTLHSSHFRVIIFVDCQYLQPLRSFLLSLLLTSPTRCLKRMVIHAFVSELSCWSVEILKAWSQHISLEIHQVSLESLSYFTQGITNLHLNKTTVLGRILLPELVGGDDIVLVLDLDTIICRCLCDLFDESVGIMYPHYGLAAVPISREEDKNDFDRQYRVFENKLHTHEVISKRFPELRSQFLRARNVSMDEYFNVGVMAVDLYHWRRRQIPQILTQLLETHIEFGLWTSDLVINPPLCILFIGRFAHLHRLWNHHRFGHQQVQAGEEAFIYHFAGDYKPWMAENLNADYWVPECVHHERKRSFCSKRNSRS